jgi:hypothetical protein
LQTNPWARPKLPDPAGVARPGSRFTVAVYPTCSKPRGKHRRGLRCCRTTPCAVDPDQQHPRPTGLVGAVRTAARAFLVWRRGRTEATGLGCMRGIFDLKAYNAGKAHRGAFVETAPEGRHQEAGPSNGTLCAGSAHHWGNRPSKIFARSDSLSRRPGG